jgi:hypothetical protein
VSEGLFVVDARRLTDSMPLIEVNR